LFKKSGTGIRLISTIDTIWIVAKMEVLLILQSDNPINHSSEKMWEEINLSLTIWFTARIEIDLILTILPSFKNPVQKKVGIRLVT